MNTIEQAHFEKLYRLHLRTLKLRGMSDNTIDSYARAVRRVSEYHDCSPDRLSTEQLEAYFAQLVESHSWSTTGRGVGSRFIVYNSRPLFSVAER
jgi:site-specific recombinase XerD